jgi:hypothetical protein
MHTIMFHSRSWDSFVSTVTWIRAARSRVQTSAMAKYFTLSQNAHTYSQTHIASQSMDKGALPFGSSSRAGPPRVRTDPMKNLSGPLRKDGLAKHLDTKSQNKFGTLTLTCRVTWPWFEMVKVYNRQMILRERYIPHSGPGKLCQLPPVSTTMRPGLKLTIHLQLEPRLYEQMELYLYSPMRLDGVHLTCLKCHSLRSIAQKQSYS